jgi:hypothetical protein
VLAPPLLAVAGGKQDSGVGHHPYRAAMTVSQVGRRIEGREKERGNRRGDDR